MKNTFKQISLYFAFALLLIALLPAYSFCSGDRILYPGRDVSILIGPFGGGYYHSDINSLYIPGESHDCLNPLHSDSKLGIVLGIKAFIPLAGAFSLSPRFDYENIGGDISRAEKVLPIFGSNNNLEPSSGVEKLDLKLNTFNVDLFVTYTFTKFGMYAALGPSIGFLTSKDYTLTGNIVSPDSVNYYSNESRSKVFATGKMNNLNSVLYSVRLGIGWNWQVSDLIYINPEVLYSIPLNNAFNDNDTKINGFLFTLGVLFSL